MAGIIILIAIYILLSFLKPTPTWKKEVITKINNIVSLARTNEVLILTSLIIEADKILDKTLKQRCVKGNTLGERLMNARSIYERGFYNSLWEAHKIRNRIAHEDNYKIDTIKAHHTINTLLKGIRVIID